MYNGRCHFSLLVGFCLDAYGTALVALFYKARVVVLFKNDVLVCWEDELSVFL